MKQFSALVFVIIFAATAYTQQYGGAAFVTQSYYGFSGLMFTPTAQISPARSGSLAYSAKPAKGQDLTLEPFSLSAAYVVGPGLELSITNTPFYASQREFGGVFIKQGFQQVTIPVFPAIKYQVMPMSRQSHQIAMAVGVALPYGAYYVVDKFFNLGLFDITLHTGVGTKLTTYHAFAGATLTFGERKGEINRAFPLELLLEGSWGGSLKQLAQKEEAFFAATFRYAWTPSLLLTTFFRVDSQALVNDLGFVRSGPIERMGLGLHIVLNSF